MVKNEKGRGGISQHNGIVSSKERGREDFLEWPELLWQSFATLLEVFFACDTVAKSHL